MSLLFNVFAWTGATDKPLTGLGVFFAPTGQAAANAAIHHFALRPDTPVAVFKAGTGPSRPAPSDQLELPLG